MVRRSLEYNPWWDLWPQTPLRKDREMHAFFDDPFSGFLGRSRRVLPATASSCGLETAREQYYYRHGNPANNTWCDASNTPESDSGHGWWGSGYGRDLIGQFYHTLFDQTPYDDGYDDDGYNDAMVVGGEMDDTPERLHRVPWLPALCLTMQDKRDLVTHAMLSDKHMYAAQKLLRTQHPAAGGLQDTCLAQTEFQPAPHGVQIHHTRGNHWVLSAGDDTGVVRVYDSLYDSITKDLHRQLNEIYQGDEDEVEEGQVYRMPAVQKQRGTRDCGLFVVAFALKLCKGQDPMSIRFDQVKMRKHLLDCFEEGVLTPFPME